MLGEGVELYTEPFGDESKPGIIFCHGFGGSARNFRLQAKLLQPRFRVTLFDLRGHARSPAPEGAESYRVEALLSDLDEIVRVQRTPLILAGLSLGAKLSLDYALQHPERVRALVLASYPTSGDVEKRRTWALGFAAAIEERGLDEAGAEFVWGEQSRFDPKGAKLIRQGLLEHAPHALAHIQRELLAASPSPSRMAPQLRELQIPTCLIAGTDDPESLGPCRELSQIMPRAELHELENAGHVVNLTRPTLFNQLLVDFLNRLEPSA
ncbi:MAG TPA: alpha/beta hydrolase [Polyangiaceae bacterium]|nr:alpha/beta hydrolase [Polyangiaceae bacterium]